MEQTKQIRAVTRHRNPLGTEDVKRLLLRFAWPSVLGLLVSALYNMVDQFFIGNVVGYLGNAATNISFPLVTLCTAISLMTGVGGAARFNLSMGRGDKDEAKRYVVNAIYMMIGLGLLVTVLTLVFLRPILFVFGATDASIGYAMEYTGITSIGFPLLIFVVAGSNLVRADGSPTYSMICTVVGCVLNMLLDPLFMYVFDMGIAGAATATVIGQAVSALMVLIRLLRFRTVQITRRDLRPAFPEMQSIARLGIAPFINQSAILAVQIVINRLFSYYGALSEYGSDIPLAAVGIVMKVSMFFFSINIGIAQGLQPIFSYNYGAGQYRRVLKALRYGITVSLVVSSLAFVLFQTFPGEIVALFGRGSDLYFRFAVRFFKIFLFMFFLNGIQPIVMTFFTSIGKPTQGIIISLSRQILFLCPLLLILAALFGIDGMFYASPITDFLAAVLSVILVLRQVRLLLRMEKEAPELDMTDDEADYDEEYENITVL